MESCMHISDRESSMPAKQFQFHADARQSILRGAGVLADAVRVTLGPKSKCVLIERNTAGRWFATTA
jgi:chaperonin GroEL (HSP60 family)